MAITTITKQMFDESTTMCPVLVEREYIVKLTKVEEVETKVGAKRAKIYLSLVDSPVYEYETGKEFSNERGRFLLIDSAMLEPTGKMTEQQVIDGVSRIFKAFLKADDIEAFFDLSEGDITALDMLEACVNKYCRIKVKHEESDEYGPGNKIAKYMPVPKDFNEPAF